MKEVEERVEGGERNTIPDSICALRVMGVVRTCEIAGFGMGGKTHRLGCSRSDARASVDKGIR